MRVAVNARSLTNTSMGAGYYTLHLFDQLAKEHPEHSFIFLSDIPVELNATSNSSVIISDNPCKGQFSLRRWLDEKVKRELIKLNAELFISLDGTGSLTTSTPQIIGITDLNFLQRGSFFTRAFQYRWFKKTMGKASSIITVSESVKQQLVAKYPETQEKISVVPKVPMDIFMPLQWQERENIKSSNADGKEYFLFTGGFDPSKNLLNVLKAFSQFKKWQQSEMKLLIAGDTFNDSTGMMQKIETFKFREDVVLLNKVQPQQLAELMAASYALIYPSLVENYGMPVLEGLRSGTSVITSKNCAVTNMVDDTVLYADPNDPENIFAQMIKLYKDEDLRSKLIRDGLQATEKFNWKNSAEMLWQVIEKTVQQR